MADYPPTIPIPSTAATASASAAPLQLNLMQQMELRPAGQADFQSACGDRNPPGRLAHCMRDNASKLSEPCRRAIDAARSHLLDATEEAMNY